MPVKVYELKPGLEGFVLDMQRIHCTIDIKDRKGSFQFLDLSCEKLIRSSRRLLIP
jgi:hypothetical protein